LKLYDKTYVMNGKQLKNSILQWAIQGKLVPQDPNDEPASVLLDKIRQEKERLIKEKKIKRDKNASIIYRGEDNSYYEKMLATGEVKCIDEEIPFEIPQGWEWCKIKHICSMQAGKNISASKIFSDCSDSHPYRCVGGNGLRGYTEDFNTEGHYSIVGRQGALCGCVNIEQGKFYATEHAVVVDTYEILSPLFMYYFLTALNLNKYATATAQPGLAVSNVLEVMCPLPPLNEGERIIEKLSLLIPLIENYNVIQEKQDILNDSIKEQLKKSVLQEAIQGKLVPQLTEEGTAQDLLEQIRIEKRNLVNGGKLKKSALATSVIFRGDDNRYYEQIGANCNDITDEIPFELPYNWCWCRFSNIVSMTIGKTPARGEQTYWINGKYNWVSISDMVDGGTISTTKEKVSDLAVKEVFSATISKKGSLLMSFKLSIGKTSILDIDAYHNEAIITIRPVIDKEYAMRNYLFKVLPLIANLGKSKDAIKGKTLNSKSLSNLLIPLPPLQEQQRIIEQMNRLSKQLR